MGARAVTGAVGGGFIGPQRARSFMDQALARAIGAAAGQARAPIATPASASADQAAAIGAASKARKRAVGTVLGKGPGY